MQYMAKWTMHCADDVERKSGEIDGDNNDGGGIPRLEENGTSCIADS
jgi:hypothetical protein